MGKNKKKSNDVVKALRRAERELQFERNGYDHPWISIDRPHKSKKQYDRKRERKNFDFESYVLSYFKLVNIIRITCTHLNSYIDYK